jgi:hypothetical protein
VKANTYSYDGARKSVEAWLLSAGWRVRAAPGAHAAVVEIVSRWLGETDNPVPRIARTFAAARRARHPPRRAVGHPTRPGQHVLSKGAARKADGARGPRPSTRWRIESQHQRIGRSSSVINPGAHR